MNFLYSTLTAPQNYAIHKKNPDGSYSIARDILINGGHGLTNRFGVLLQGALTEVDDETLSLLEQDYVFCLHRDNGYIKVDRKKHEVESAISDLNQRDKSSPATAQDIDALYDDGAIPVPVTEYKADGKPRSRNAMQ
jgi:hypothetical protein